MKTAKIARSLLGPFVAIAFGSLALAQSVPSLVNYQGRLTDTAGVPMLAGTYAVQFRIWDDAQSTNSGHLIWGQQQMVGVQSGGVFNVLLGAPGGTPLPGAAVNDLRFAFTAPSRLIGVTVLGKVGTSNTVAAEILPRQQLLSIPFAIVAGSVSPGAIVSSSLAPGAVGSGAIAPGAVGADQISSGSVGTAQLALGAVGSAQLADGVIGFAPRNVQAFTSSGTWVRPASVNKVYVKMWGGGGGGGGGAAGSGGGPGGGGGGGGYCEGAVLVAGDISVVVGVGGNGGVYSDGKDGGDSSFSASPKLTAMGGYGGLISHVDRLGSGGQGGNAVGAMFNVSGSNGRDPVSVSVSRSIAVYVGGTGGASFLSQGGVAGGYDTYYSQTYGGGSIPRVGGDGCRFGAGGGGGPDAAGGGAGADGLVVVYY